MIRLRNDRPSTINADLLMPEQNGFEIAHLNSATHKLRH